jgi:gentisate 1,2-dioxygenase
MSIDVSHAHTVEVGYDEFCGALAARDLKAPWSMQAQLLSNVPLPATQPWLWKWDTIYSLAKRAGEIITVERGGDRRVLAFANPGLNGLPFTSSTLWGAIQYLGPGESAPAHRHTPSAIRFVMAGSGVYTTVDGDACDMEPGDLILTPNWNWHDHNNHGSESMVWFDGLDLPLVTTLDAIFFENHPERVQPVIGHNLSERLYVSPGLVDPNAASPPGHSPLLRYRWVDADRCSSRYTRSAAGQPQQWSTAIHSLVQPSFRPLRARCTGSMRVSARRRAARPAARSTWSFPAGAVP